MSDYTKSKSFGTKAYPVEAHEASNLLGRAEPIITPDLLISRYLKSQEKIIREKYSMEELSQEINLAINEVELLTHLSVFKVQHRERIPFDRDLYKSFVYMKLNNGPILSVEEIQIQSSNGENIYNLPATWIETGLSHKRQLNLIPILSIFGAAGLADGQASNAGLIFLQAINNFQFLPSFFTVLYTCGISHTEGQVPVIINEIIGMVAAISILSSLQSNYLYTSTSVGQDGVSQAASGPGPKVYTQRMEELEAKKEKILKRIKSIFNQKYYMSNI